MERQDEKQPATSTSPETPAPASSSLATASQLTPGMRSDRSELNATGRPAPAHSLRNEIRVWTLSEGQLLRQGRSSHQLQRFARFRTGREPVYLRARRICLLARRSFRLALYDRLRYKVNGTA